MLSEKGKYASATENRRFVWKEIVWPLILENNDVSFTLKQYQRERDQVCQTFNVSITTLSRGLASLIQKELLLKENEIYSIHYRLIAYMRLKAECDYGTAVHETKIKYHQIIIFLVRAFCLKPGSVAASIGALGAFDPSSSLGRAIPF